MSAVDAQHTRVDAFEELGMADYGDAAVDPESSYRSIEPIRGVVREIADAGTLPFVIGGDHSLMYPDVAALADVYGKGKIGEILTGIAMRKQGITDPHYLHPDAVDHGQGRSTEVGSARSGWRRVAW